jgi:hypothetical protein
MTLTVANVIAAVRDRLDEPTAAQWDDIELKRWMNEAGRDIARRTKHIKDTTTLTTTANVAEYVVPANVIEIEDVYFAPGDGRQIQLSMRAFEGMGQVWGSQMDRGGGWPAMVTWWGTPPQLKIRLYPVPGESGRTITLYVSRLPATITETNDVDDTACDLPLAWVDLLKDYIEYRALRKDRNPAWQESFSIYNTNIDQMVRSDEYANVQREMILDPRVRGGYVQSWFLQEMY